MAQKQKNELTYEQMLEIKGDPKLFAEIVDSFVNSMSSSDAKAVAEEVARTHRTLQQGTFGMCLAIIFALSQNGTDLRNEYAVRDAKKICELLDIKDFRDINYMTA